MIYNFTPSGGAKIRNFFWNLLVSFGVILLLSVGIDWIVGIDQFPSLATLVNIAILIALGISFYRGFLRPQSFEISPQQLVVRRGSSVRKYSLKEYKILEETGGVSLWGFPLAARRLLLARMEEDSQEKPIGFSLAGYTQKEVAAIVAAARQTAKSSDGEAGDSELHPSPPALDPTKTYTIVSEVKDLQEEQTLGTFFLLLGLGIGAMVLGFFLEDLAIMIIGLLILGMGIWQQVSSKARGPESSAMLSAEIAPDALTIGISDYTEIFPWESIAKIQLTPLGYVSSARRVINVLTEQEIYRFTYGEESNEALRKNYETFIQGLTLHVPEKIEFLYR